MAKTLATTKTAKKTTAAKTTKVRNTLTTTATKKATTNRTKVKQIEKMYNDGMGPRRIGKIINMPRHHVMRVIEDLGLFIYAEGSYR
jgi:transposase-like protein